MSTIALIFALASCTSGSPDGPGSSEATSTANSSAVVAPASSAPDGPGFSTESLPSGVSAPASEYNPTPTIATSEDPETALPAATTPVPAPGGGDVNQTVPAVELSTQPAVGLTDQANFGGGVTVRLDKIDAITAEAQVPGEVSGPGLAITVSIENASDAEIDLGNVIVNVEDAEGFPANPMIGPPASPISGVLPAGEAASGIYVFALPDNYQTPATISVSYSTGAPVVLFVGDAQ